MVFTQDVEKEEKQLGFYIVHIQQRYTQIKDLTMKGKPVMMIGKRRTEYLWKGFQFTATNSAVWGGGNFSD